MKKSIPAVNVNKCKHRRDLLPRSDGTGMKVYSRKATAGLGSVSQTQGPTNLQQQILHPSLQGRHVHVPWIAGTEIITSLVKGMERDSSDAACAVCKILG